MMKTLLSRSGWVVPTCLIVWISSAACSSGITRSNAKGVIQESREFATIEGGVFLSDAQIIAGERAGLWVRESFGGFSTSIRTTPAGQKIGHFDSGCLPIACSFFFEQPVRREVVEITGMTDVEANTKQVNVTWKYAGVPDAIAIHQAGVAILQLFDDGWRLVQFQ